MDLNEFVEGTMPYRPYRAALVDALWIEGPAAKAYHRLKGTDIQYGVIQETVVRVNDKDVYCSWFMWSLTALRKDNPEEQLLEMLR